MATVTDQAPSAQDPQFAGPYGNASRLRARYTPGKVKGATGDSVVVDLARIPSGTSIDGINVIWSALGTAATAALGFRWSNPAGFVPTGAPTPAADALLAATAAASAGGASATIHPITFPIEAVLTATFAGSSGANILPSTADVYVSLDYISQGV
jgi:hypothetical protein